MALLLAWSSQGAGSLDAADRLAMRASAPLTAEEQGPVLRDIFDPILGQHWQLRIDPLHPDGPRRMVLLSARPALAAGLSPGGAEPSSHGGAANGTAGTSNGPAASPPSAPVFVIRAGDRIAVEQDSQFVRAQLQAVALESAGAGAVLRVRLGGGILPDLNAPVVSVRALGPGAAQWIAVERSGR